MYDVKCLCTCSKLVFITRTPSYTCHRVACICTRRSGAVQGSPAEYMCTHTHRCRHTLEHREASLAHGLHMAKPTFIRASVNMCACVCHSDTKALPDMAEGISISVSSSLPSPAVLFDTHTHTCTHFFFTHMHRKSSAIRLQRVTNYNGIRSWH